MGIRNLYRKIKSYRSHDKVVLDQYLDTTMLWTGANAIGLIGLNSLQNYVSDNLDSNEGLAVLGVYVGWGILQALANELLLSKATDKVNGYNNKKRAAGKPATFLSWTKTAGAGLALGALLFTSPFTKAFSNIYYDIKTGLMGAAYALEDENIKIAKEMEEQKLLDATPEALKVMVPNNLDIYISECISRTSKVSDEGRTCRALRWDELLTENEARYGIPSGLLAGLAMQESYGNALELNLHKGGDAGLMQFHPYTAKDMGLIVFGKINGWVDRTYGAKLEEMVKETCQYNYDCIRVRDERFDVVKVIPAAGRHLREKYDIYKDWNKALSAYNLGTPAENYLETNHVKQSNRFQRLYIETKRKLGLATTD